MRGWRKELGSSPSHRQRRPLLPRTNPGCQRAFVPRSLRLGAGGGMKTGPEEHPGGLLCQGLVPSGSPLPSSSRCWPTAGWRSPAEPALGAGSCGAHPAPRSGAWSNALGRGGGGAPVPPLCHPRLGRGAWAWSTAPPPPVLLRLPGHRLCPRRAVLLHASALRDPEPLGGPVGTGSPWHSSCCSALRFRSWS